MARNNSQNDNRNNNQNNNRNNNQNNNQNQNNNRNNNQNNNQNNNRNNNQNNSQNNNRNNNQNNNQNKNNKQKNNQNDNNNNNQKKGNSKPCLNCYKPGHFQSECTAECGNCGLRGHTRNKCSRPGKEHESAKPYCEDCNNTTHSTEACTRCKYCDTPGHKSSSCTKLYKKLAWEEEVVECGNCFVVGHGAASCRNPNASRGWKKDEDGKPKQPDYLPPPIFQKQQPLPEVEVQPLFNPQAIPPHCERCEAHGVPAILPYHDHKTCQNLRYCRFCNLTTHNDDQCRNVAGQESYRRAGGAPCAKCNSMGHNFLQCKHWNPGEDLTMLPVHSESILVLDSWILNYNIERWGYKKPRSDIYTTMHKNVSVGLHYLFVPAIVELVKKGFTLRCRRCTTRAILHDPLSEDIVMGSCEADVNSLSPQNNDEAILGIDCNCYTDGMVWNRIAPPEKDRLGKYANPWHGN